MSRLVLLPFTTLEGELEIWDEGLVPTAEPLYPDYAEYEARLETFRSPRFKCAKTAEELAAAGFIFNHRITEYHDSVKCHWCFYDLIDWEPEDDAVGEHLRFSPDCLFARSFGKSQPTDRMRARWLKASPCIELLECGLPEKLLHRAFDHIFESEMAFPQTSKQLLTIVEMFADAHITDTPAEPDTLKCVQCANQAIIMAIPCSHVSYCYSCSSEDPTPCPKCGQDITYRVIVHLC